MLFELVRILFPVAIGGIAGVTASAAGSGGAVCHRLLLVEQSYTVGSRFAREFGR